jgi:hypothetical protein
MPTSLRLLALLAVLGLAHTACGVDDDDDDTGDSWQELLSGAWSLQAGSEDWYCVSKTFDEDVYIGAFRPVDPAGTHHTVMTYGPPTGPDRASEPCAPDDTSPFTIYASGVNTNPLEMPAGVGFKIEAGQQVHLNLHVFNTGEAALTGTSGVEIQTISADEVVHEAETFLPGAFGFAIPQNQEYSYSSNCDIAEEQYIFALFPHMHQLGRHFKSELTIGGETQVLWDEDYQFEAQTFASFDPIKLSPGDRITSTCSWFYPPNPDGPETVQQGDSSTEEMCFGITMRYPRLNLDLNSEPSCTDEQDF